MSSSIFLAHLLIILGETSYSFLNSVERSQWVSVYA
jgi:hypothetical protein